MPKIRPQNEAAPHAVPGKWKTNQHIFADHGQKYGSKKHTSNRSREELWRHAVQDGVEHGLKAVDQAADANIAWRICDRGKGEEHGAEESR